MGASQGSSRSTNGRDGLGMAAGAMAWIMRRLLRLSLLRTRWSHRSASSSSSTTDEPLLLDVHARLIQQERALAQAYMRVARGGMRVSDTTWSVARCASHHAIQIGSASAAVTTIGYQACTHKGQRSLTRFRLEVCPAAASELAGGCKPIEHSWRICQEPTPPYPLHLHTLRSLRLLLNRVSLLTRVTQ